MSEETKGVEEKVEVAPTQPEVDLAKELEETRTALAKKTEDAENYKRGMLKAKGKIPDDSSGDDDVETLEEKMRRIAREEQAQSEVAQLQAKEKSQVDALLKQNRELKVALNNRGQISSPSAPGSNQDKQEVNTDSYFSKDQVSALKAKGWSDEKIETAKKNMRRGAEMPK